MSITIENLKVPVSFLVTLNKGKENESSYTVNTTLDFSHYSAEDFINRTVDSTVIAIQGSLRNPPKDPTKGVKREDLEGKEFKPNKPGERSAAGPEKIKADATKILSKMAPADALAMLLDTYKRAGIPVPEGVLNQINNESN